MPFMLRRILMPEREKKGAWWVLQWMGLGKAACFSTQKGSQEELNNVQIKKALQNAKHKNICDSGPS